MVVAAAAAAGLVFLLRSPAVDRTPPPPETVVRASRQSAAMPLESDPAVIRFGTPAAEVHEVHGFEHSRPDPAAEPSVGIRRRAEVRLRWPEPGAPRSGPRPRRPRRSRPIARCARC